MNKARLMKFLLVAMPLAAVAVAAMPTSVVVYPVQDGLAYGMPYYCSYFTLVTDVNTSVCAPFAALLAALTFGLVVIWLVSKKQFWLKGVMVTSCASMTLAVLPVLVEKSVYMLPNVAVPICMGAVCLCARLMVRKKVSKEEKNSKRLQVH